MAEASNSAQVRVAPGARRAGLWLLQPSGYRAFVPAAATVLQYDELLVEVLTSASDALGRLDGATQTLPNPELFVALYVRREAVLSSQIEGAQPSLDDVLACELDPGDDRLPQDVEEIVHYVRAMNYGLERLSSLPLSLRLLREIHAELMASGGGADKEPGEFRRTQNWIGGAGATLAQAAFVPPPPHEMLQALGDLEGFLHRPRRPPPLIECGLVHAQFETDHPFLDGNGVLAGCSPRSRRLGGLARLSSCVGLRRPPRRRRGPRRRSSRSVSASVTCRSRTASASTRPERWTCCSCVRWSMSTWSGVSSTVNYATANKLVEQLQDLGILTEITGGRRNRVFRHTPYLRLFSDAGPSE